MDGWREGGREGRAGEREGEMVGGRGRWGEGRKGGKGGGRIDEEQMRRACCIVHMLIGSARGSLDPHPLTPPPALPLNPHPHPPTTHRQDPPRVPELHRSILECARFEHHVS